MQRLSRLLPSLRVSHLVAGLACVVCFVAGYLLAGSWSDANDTTPLEQICARGDHVNSLQEELPEQTSEEVRPYRNSLLRCTVCPVICLRITSAVSSAAGSKTCCQRPGFQWSDRNHLDDR
jgi:hypothetical protein